ncbi:MAG: hypothetical protein ABL959_10240 [Pyrinomonadaceae bacterium]
MNKTKLDDRIENAVNAFFETPADKNKFALTYTGHDAALIANEMSFGEKADKWQFLIREILMFGPGSILVFYVTLIMILFYQTLGVGISGLFLYLFSTFLVYAGSGSLTKVKNLAVPAAVTVLAFGFAFISPSFLDRELGHIYMWDSIFLFPIVLIVAKLVQSFLADKN